MSEEQKNTGLNINEMVEKLKTWRDELNVQAHLMKADAKDEWVELEKKWNQLVTSAKTLEPKATEIANDIAEDVKDNATKISQLLTEKYAQIKETLKKGKDT
jgi:seryl-tRNA synthetase